MIVLEDGREAGAPAFTGRVDGIRGRRILRGAVMLTATFLLAAVPPNTRGEQAGAGGAQGATLLQGPPTAEEGGPQENLLRIFVLDVDNGHFVCESLVVVTPGNKVMLIDAAFPSPTFRYGGAVHHYGTNLVPVFLEGRGITAIAWMMLSHPHDDHIGDMPKIVASDVFTVGKVLWSPIPGEKLRKAEEGGVQYEILLDDLVQSCRDHGVPMQAVRAGDVLDLGDGVQCGVLAVAEPELDVPNYINNNSIVMRLTYRDFSMMFTGDAGIEEENRILATGEEVRSDVLKIGHHAGAGSNSEEWLRAVKAKVGVASMPQWLSEDHRGKDVYQRLTNVNTRVFRTWENGTIEVQTDGERFWVIGSR